MTTPLLVSLLFGFLVLLLGLQTFFQICILRPLISADSAKSKKVSESVSIVICAHNEAENLKQFLPSILKQDYPHFEVIVVNDRSKDNSIEILEKFQSPNLTTVHINEVPKGFNPKKYALKEGIKKAQNDIILLTDADCRPNSPFWIQEIANHLGTEKDIVLGYSPYLTTDTTVNTLIQFDTLYTASLYFSFANAGYPYMGVGRNLMYRRKIFEKNSAFEKYKNTTGGDDDLIINAVANQRNTSICLHPNSFVASVPKNTLKGWITQKQRHLSVGKHYTTKTLLLLGLQSLSSLQIPLAIVALALLPYPFKGISLLFLFSYFYRISLLKQINNRLKGTLSWGSIFLCDIFYPLGQFSLGFLSFFKRRIRWEQNQQ